MTVQRFFSNPHFRAYVRLLHQLHQLIRAGTDETAEGGALRERMDEPADFLTQEEIDCLKGISADFYTLSNPPWQVQPSPPALREEPQAAIEARDRGDFVGAFDLLRKNQFYRDTATVSSMRGMIWLQARENEIAVDFFRRAKELAPQNGYYGAMWLDALWQTNAEEALTISKAILRRPTDHPPVFVLKAADVVFAATRQLPSNEEKAVLGEVLSICKDSVIRLQTSEEAELNPLLLASALGLLGRYHARLGDVTEAIKCFDKGLQLSPNNDVLLIARGIHRYVNDTAQSVQDFQLAIRLRSPHDLPYFFLAHHYLRTDRYSEALGMASQALQLASSDELRADCLEWIAICQAVLGRPAETVRAAFRAALELAPDNQRIARNRQLFEDHLAGSVMPPVPWERVPPEPMRALGQKQPLPVPGLGSFALAS